MHWYINKRKQKRQHQNTTQQAAIIINMVTSWWSKIESGVLKSKITICKTRSSRKGLYTIMSYPSIYRKPMIRKISWWSYVNMLLVSTRHSRSSAWMKIVALSWLAHYWKRVKIIRDDPHRQERNRIC